MRIELRTRRLSGQIISRDRVVRRLHFALGRFLGSVVRVQVTMEDVRGSLDKRCCLRLQLAGGGPPILAEDNDPVVASALERASLRLGRNVARAIDRARSQRIG